MGRSPPVAGGRRLPRPREEDLPGHGQFTTLAGVLQTQLLNAAIPIAEKTGIDVFAGDQALSIGEPPRRAVRLDERGGGALRRGPEQKLGAEPQDALGRHFLAIGEEGGFDVKSPRWRSSAC